MVAADLHSRPPELDTTNVFQARDDLNLLTSAAVYGANASGKSNLIAALHFMRNLVLNSSRDTRLREPIDVAPYRLSTETEHAPSRFEIVFIQKSILYRYGFLVSRKQVEEEWLFATNEQKEGYLFERTADGIRVNRRTFKEGEGLQERTRPNALFLSVAAQWNGKRASNILEWFENLAVNSGVDDQAAERRRVQQYSRTKLSPEVIAFVRALDLGIEDMTLEPEPDQEIPMRDDDGSIQMVTFSGATRIRTAHAKYDSQDRVVATELFDLLTHESHGTRRLFSLAEPILAALRSGTVLAVDEIDARLHPILTCEIIRLFNTPEANPRHAQLIFTSHDTNLLGSGLLRRDQIWFVEKSRKGESILYSLAEYKVRNDLAYEKNYIAGRFGAIPYLGSLSALIGADHAEPAEIEADAGASVDDSELYAALGGDEG